MGEFFTTKKWWKLIPDQKVVSTGRCLSETGAQYVVWLNGGGPVNVNLTAANGQLLVEWFDPVNGRYVHGSTIEGGDIRSFVPPFSGDAVLYITKLK